jgi:hypothetical protein
MKYFAPPNPHTRKFSNTTPTSAQDGGRTEMLWFYILFDFLSMSITQHIF